MAEDRPVQPWKQYGLLIFNGTAGVASIVSLFIELWSRPEKTSMYLFIQSLLIEAALLALVCYLALSLKDKYALLRERDVLRERINNVNHALRRLHEVPHSCRNVLVSFGTGTGNGIGRDWFQLQLNAMANVYKDLIGCQCSLCIKVLSNNNADVSTLCRDSESQSRRSALDKESRVVASNTAFNSIMHNRDQYYGSNDLASLGRSYRNDTPNWQDFYSSAIVVPIQFADDKDRAVLGFLCVDAPDKGVFELEPHAYLLGIAADSLYLPLDQYRRMLDAQIASQGTRKR